MSIPSSPCRIVPLEDVPEAAPLLARIFKEEWPDFFADRPAEAIQQQFFASGAGSLPVVLVALRDGRVCGTVALRERSVETHGHLGPWVTGLYVTPTSRGFGIGRSLMHAITEEAGRRGFPYLYAVTNTARGLFSKLGWTAIEEIPYHGEEVTLYVGSAG